MYGMRRSASCASIALTLAICISDSTPSCMRAPPDAQTTISGCLRSSERWPSRAIFSPTTDPIEPPMKAKSITPRLTGRSAIVPAAASSASPSPAFAVAFFRRAGYSGKPSGSVDLMSSSSSSIVPSSSRRLQYSFAR